MSVLEWSEILRRKVRGGSFNELTLPNWTLIRDAINSGEVQEATGLLDYCHDRPEEWARKKI